MGTPGKGMLEAQQKEWDKYRCLNPAVAVPGEEKARLCAEGHQVFPSSGHLVLNKEDIRYGSLMYC